MINCSKWFRLAPLVIHNLHKIRNRSSSKNENSWHPSKDHENSWKKKLCMVDERIVLSPIFSVNQLIWCEWFMHRLDIASLMNLNMSKILVCFSHKDMEYPLLCPFWCLKVPVPIHFNFMEKTTRTFFKNSHFVSHRRRFAMIRRIHFWVNYHFKIGNWPLR